MGGQQNDWAAFSGVNPWAQPLSLTCLAAGEHTDNRHPAPGRILPCFAAVYVSEGSGLFHAGSGATLRVSAPAVMWLFPGRPHSYSPAESGWSEHWLMVDGAEANLFFESRFRKLGVTQLSEGLEVGELFGRIRTGLLPQTQRGVLSASVAARSLLLSFAEAATEEEETDDLLSRFSATARLDLSMVDRAETLGMTYRELVRELKAHAGVTPVEYLISLRVSTAQELLATTNSLISDIAEEVGIPDLAYFSRVFTRRVGISPSQFREEQRRLARQVSEHSAER